MKCDYCRGPLGPFVYRYWRMRFARRPAKQRIWRDLTRKRGKNWQKDWIEIATRSEAI